MSRLQYETYKSFPDFFFLITGDKQILEILGDEFTSFFNM